MAVQKYDIRKLDGTFEQRYWSPINKPVLDSTNEVVYIIHRVEDVTEFMVAKKGEAEKEGQLFCKSRFCCANRWNKNNFY